eukprot:GEMP01089887.1.p1 GENE.GEMP01089887.1~~GEMP01089887.1.p1  ORF type:complete len:219 (+),score=44.24 GEMP01089887.1:35-691(+)
MTDYAASPEVQKLWKEFGCDKAAGRLLRQLYNGRPPTLIYPKVPKFRKQKPEQQPAFPLTGGKKSYDQIQEETAGHQDNPDPGPPGVNRDLMKAKLQDHHTFGGGNALPKGAMGYNVAMGAVQPLPRKVIEEQEAPGDLSKEDSELFEEICHSIKQKQDDLRSYEKTNVGTGPADARRRMKENAFREKERLRLKNEIASDLKDLNKILDLTKDDGDQR